MNRFSFKSSESATSEAAGSDDRWHRKNYSWYERMMCLPTTFHLSLSTQPPSSLFKRVQVGASAGEERRLVYSSHTGHMHLQIPPVHLVLRGVLIGRT